MMTDNKHITSFIARSIQDVSFSELVKKNKALFPPGSKPVFFDDFQAQIDKIQNFSAFIAKVHHNFLWSDFPVTKQLLTTCKMDIQVFKAYLPLYQKNRRAGKEEKINRFISFLHKFLLTSKTYKSRLILQALLHENAIFTAGSEAVMNGIKLEQAPPDKCIITSEEVPFIQGILKIVPLAIRPDMINHDLLSTMKNQLPKRRKWYCYWFSPGCNEARIFEINTFTKSLLVLIDGKNNLDFIAKSLHAKDGCKGVITDLVDKGIASYK